MSELTPEKIEAQDKVRRKLRALRQESESFFARRDETIMEGDALNMSLRDIGGEIGMSPQGVSNVITRVKAEQAE